MALRSTLSEPTVVCAAVTGCLRVAYDPTWLTSIHEGYGRDKYCTRLCEQIGSLGMRETNGLLFVGERLVIPRIRDVREVLFRCAHDALGHFGFDKSHATLCDAYHWPNMQKELETMYIPSCEDCQQNKGSTGKPSGPLHPLPVPDGRGEAIAIDFVGKLPEDNGFDCIATITCRLGADMRLIPTRTDITAEEFAVQFFDHWYCENGLPTEIVSDRNRLFISTFWKALHILTGVKVKLSTLYHPETDSASERTNKTMIQSLQYHIQRNQKGWARALPRVHFAIMNSVNASTGFSRFQLHLGRSPHVLPPLVSAATPIHDARLDAKSLLERIETDIMEAQDNLFLAKLSQASCANTLRSEEWPYSVGDMVMLSTFHRQRNYMQHGDHRVAKFMVHYDGPYKVLHAYPESSAYTLDLPNTM